MTALESLFLLFTFLLPFVFILAVGLVVGVVMLVVRLVRGRRPYRSQVLAMPGHRPETMRHCTYCSCDNESVRATCSMCGRSLSPAVMTVAGRLPRFSGFWRRFFAYFLDTMVLIPY